LQEFNKLSQQEKINSVLSDLVQDISDIQTNFNHLYRDSMKLNEEHFPRVYNLRGICMNIQSILNEVQKGINSEYVDLSYFNQKLESLNSDIKGFVNSYTKVTNGNYRRSN
jgi:hypothetical protein